MMLEGIPQVGSLVLYRQQAAVVQKLGKKLEVKLASGEIKSLRDKDVLLLDRGPITSLDAVLQARPEADIEGGWELLNDEEQRLCDLQELCSLLYGEVRAETIWACFELLNSTPYFKGTPLQIVVRSRLEVEDELRLKRKKAEEKELWDGVLERLERGQLLAEDRKYFSDVEQLAYGQNRQPTVFKLLRLQPTAADAHSFLLCHRLWEPACNPYPQRCGVSTEELGCTWEVEQIRERLQGEERRDLTHLQSVAVDDPSSSDPDDALSRDGDCLWVHIADVAALIDADSDLDLAAKERGGSLYLPEGTTPMLPAVLVAELGLGLQKVSPALSFKIGFDEDDCHLIDYCPSWISVCRQSYEGVDELIGQGTIQDLAWIVQKLRHFLALRTQNGAIKFQFPEIRLKLSAGRVDLQVVPASPARQYIGEAMVLTGYAVAKFCREHQIVIPYVNQTAPSEKLETVETLVQAFAARRKMTPSVTKLSPGRHFGLGLSCYTRPTSPLRRYFDLVVHQQLRRYYYRQPLLSEEQVLERKATAEQANGRLRATMRHTHRHWLLTYLEQQQRKEWSAVLVDKREGKGLFHVAELGLEVWVSLKAKLALGEEATLHWQSIDLARGEAIFKYGMSQS